MRTSAIIHLDRFLRNFEAVRNLIGQERHICVPVKADAYGHGALKIAQTALKAGAFCLGVGTVGEGADLRKEGIDAPILLFTQPHPQEIPAVLEKNLTPFVSEASFANALNKKAVDLGLKLPIHMKIDTGMGRIGCLAEDALELARHISSCPGLELAGIATHFAVSDSAAAADIAYTQQQTRLFVQAVETIKTAGINPGIVHAANSGAVVQHPSTWFDMVRPGLFLYGYDLSAGAVPRPEPVMELKTTVALIKKIKKGDSVSYGKTWIADKDTHIGVLPVGYADGFPRLASGKWQVVIGGSAYPQIGRICMDQCCVDLGTDLKVHQWDEAVVFGAVLGEIAMDAAALAGLTGTIPYEITCNINKRVPRVYI